jgi:hypothetical protein
LSFLPVASSWCATGVPSARGWRCRSSIGIPTHPLPAPSRTPTTWPPWIARRADASPPWWWAARSRTRPGWPQSARSSPQCCSLDRRRRACRRGGRLSTARRAAPSSATPASPASAAGRSCLTSTPPPRTGRGPRACVELTEQVLGAPLPSAHPGFVGVSSAVLMTFRWVPSTLTGGPVPQIRYARPVGARAALCRRRRVTGRCARRGTP